jgi:hypothetical protein
MSQPPATPPRQPSYCDRRVAQLAAQRAAVEAATPRSPPPPSHLHGGPLSPMDLRVFLLAKRRLEAEGKS